MKTSLMNLSGIITKKWRSKRASTLTFIVLDSSYRKCLTCQIMTIPFGWIRKCSTWVVSVAKRTLQTDYQLWKYKFTWPCSEKSLKNSRKKVFRPRFPQTAERLYLGLSEKSIYYVSIFLSIYILLILLIS